MRNSKQKNSLILIAALLLMAVPVMSHDYVPGSPQDHPILLKNGDLYTVANGILEKTDLLFENGRITNIGPNLSPPDNTEIINLAGKRVYPGIIAPNTSLGLTEIGAVAATSDRSERGRFSPEIKTHIAYNPDSEIIPTVRSNGITTALIVPGGSLVRGRSSLINLDGWTKEDAMERENLGLHVNWPRSSVITAWWIEKTAEEQKKENSENIKKIYEIFDKAVAYDKAKKADSSLPTDSKLEAMRPIFSGELPVFIHAGDIREIDRAVAFSKKYGLRIILVGGKDALMAADLLKDNDIPVILGRTQSMPPRREDGYDMAYKRPGMLAEVGVRFCISYGSASGVRNLPFQAGQAVAFGLSKEAALRSITLSTAEILGVEQDLGSLEIGKKATLIVSDGDLLDMLGNNIIYEFIEGRRVDLNDKHKELYKKYREKTL